MTPQLEGRPRFSFNKTIQELEYLSKWVRPYIDPASIKRLGELRDNLDAFRLNRGRDTYALDISEREAITTQPTRAYESGSGAEAQIGQFWFKMAIRKVPHKSHSTHFELSGETTFRLRIEPEASFQRYGHRTHRDATEINVINDDEAGRTDKPPTSWHFDVATPAPSVGALTHTQFSDPIPRLPSYCLLPTDALEFLLAELLHDKWNTITGGKDYEAFARLQKARTLALIDAQRNALAEAGPLSSWAGLRGWRPAVPLVLSG